MDIDPDPNPRRLLRLETVNGRAVFTHLSDSELDDRLRAELAAWLRDDPDACPPTVRAEVLTAIADRSVAAGASELRNPRPAVPGHQENKR